ncbi:inturned planar cell polarity protein [Leptinotarsa decemlineata]|uniref:inturned planar cell polarity protein n=1 Tax=Leptinotarsa decemlineata TaxID=7539 RepID=UPI003D30830D
MESQRLLGAVTLNNSESTCTDEEEWSDGSSYSSYYSDSDSTIPDWEPYVDDFTGELLYIECHPFVVQNNRESKSKTPPEPLARSQLRRSTRGKFLRLLRRRESKRRSKKNQKLVDVNELNTSKVKFQDFQEGEEKEVMLEIDSENRHNLSSDKSLAESLLGLIVSTLSDGNRVMIAGFSYDSKAKQERNIKIGDWLKSINNIEVNVHNLDDILQKFINRDDVLLKLQRVAGIEVTKDPPINELNIESDFVRELLNSKSDIEDSLLEALCKYSAGIVYVDTEKLSETNQNNEDVIYCFPKPIQKNVLCQSRGMFITLNHLLEEMTATKPKVSSMKCNGHSTHVVYTNFNKNLLLFMLPNYRAKKEEIILMNNEIIRHLQFCYETVDKSFSSEQHLSQIDHFFMRFFTRTLSSRPWTTMQEFSLLQNLGLEEGSFQFEEVMTVAQTLCLPDEAQVQIDDALSELEASDYRDWNEEPLDCQRLFTILGSALFHSGYLLATHFIHEDLIDVYCFCKLQGLFHLSRTEPVKSLVLWKEVFPYSCNRLQNSNVKVPDGRRYLLVVESAKDLLAVLMEAGGCTEPSENNMGPDAFYVEEAQATLAHIQELGLSELCERLLSLDPYPQITKPVPQVNRRKSDFMNINFSKAGSASVKDSLTAPKREVTSILKKRSSDQNYVAPSSSSNSLQDDSFDGQSEGSGSQGGYSEISDDSRRNLKRGSKYDSTEEDSDPEDYAEGSQLSTGSYDISEIRQYILSETEDFQPLQLTSGNENVLYHFVQLDIAKGILLCPPESPDPSLTYSFIMDNFKRCSLKMHKLFQNTLRFKNMPAQDMAKSVMNKSLIAIKEHGMLFNCPYLDEKEKKCKITYWVLGRILYMPQPKEVYVCYQDSIPQNMIEIAFKLCSTSLC